MDREMLNKRKVTDEIVANDFAKLNGAVIRTMGNVFHSTWFKASDLKVVFRDKDEADIFFSLDYLQQCGAVAVRHIESKEHVEINDFDLDEVEIRLTADGIKLLMFRKKDELIDI
jgi:hypothetical protein